MCDHLWHLWPTWGQFCFAKNWKKSRETNEVSNSKLWKFVTVTNVANGHTLRLTGTNPLSISVWIPDQNDSHDLFVQWLKGLGHRRKKERKRKKERWRHVTRKSLTRNRERKNCCGTIPIVLRSGTVSWVLSEYLGPPHLLSSVISWVFAT